MYIRKCKIIKKLDFSISREDFYIKTVKLGTNLSQSNLNNMINNANINNNLQNTGVANNQINQNNVNGQS